MNEFQDHTPNAPMDSWSTAVGHAKESARSTGEPAFVYHRADDDKWFVLQTDDTAGAGQILETVVHPRSMMQRGTGHGGVRRNS